MAKQIKMEVLRGAVRDACDRACEASKLALSPNPLRHTIGVRAEGQQEAFQSVLNAIDGSANDLMIAAGHWGRSRTEVLQGYLEAAEREER